MYYVIRIVLDNQIYSPKTQFMIDSELYNLELINNYSTGKLNSITRLVNKLE